MKTGKTLMELAQTLQDIKDNSRDFLVPTAKLSVDQDLNLVFENGSKHAYQPNSYSHGQIAGYTGVPKAYYDRLKAEAPELLSQNINHGFRKAEEAGGRAGKPETRMVRTYNGQARAILSSSYRRLDSFDLCNHVLPVLADRRLEIASSEVTEARMYLKALMPELKSEVKVGDVVQYGLLITNSDVGAGSLRVEPLIYRLVCKNGLITSTAIRKFHAGKNLAGDDVTELFSDETKRLTDDAFFAQVRDIVLGSMRPEIFEAEVARIREAAGQKITNYDVPEVVELAMSTIGVRGEGIKNSIIGYLANGADGAGLTKWGLVNGFTFAAQAESIGYDQSVDLERAGAKILDLNKNQWRKIAEVAA